MVLMALATIRAETESFEPISEGKSKFNTSPGGRPFDCITTIAKTWAIKVLATGRNFADADTFSSLVARTTKNMAKH